MMTRVMRNLTISAIDVHSHCKKNYDAMIAIASDVDSMAATPARVVARMDMAT